VVANGDITSPEKARAVLAATGADALMIGRAAQGRPWIFREIATFWPPGEQLAPPLVAEVRRLLLAHLQDHYSLYGELTGVRSARKHIGWYLRGLPGGEAFRQRINTGSTAPPCSGRWWRTTLEELADTDGALPAQSQPAPGNQKNQREQHEQETHRRMRAREPGGLLSRPGRHRAGRACTT
jgi:tRNA-dihydrouridine synthase B